MMQAKAEQENEEKRRLAIVQDEENQKKNHWKGWYAQDDRRTEMTFESLKIKKTKIRGHGSDINGEFKIEGKVKHDEVEFTKQYIGKHAVHYSGKLKGHTLSGRWSIA